MESKKNEKYDLERRRPLFFSIGMVITLSMTLVAFEWKSPIDPEIELDDWIVIECELPIFPIPLDSMTYPAGPPATIWSEEGVVLTNNLKYDAESYSSGKESIHVQPAEDPPVNSYLIDNMIYSIVDVMPEFEGGVEKFSDFIDEHLRYPSQAKRMGIEGRVFVKYVVEKNGSITNVEVIKGLGAGCNEEAIKVVKLFPNFTPATMEEVPVRVQMVVPIHFKLQ
ncbi:energy transducer TonB [Ekhidna sp.]